jgi:MSHA pilin protein MshC
MPIPRRCRCSGFTLVELVSVVLIAAVIAAVAIPRMVNQSAFQSRGTAAEVRTALRYAQRLAMAKDREVCVATTATSLTLTYNPTTIPGTGCIPVISPDDGAPYVVTPPPGVTLTPGIAFRFDGLGQPVPNAGVAVSVSGTAPIRVAVETGYVQ